MKLKNWKKLINQDQKMQEQFRQMSQSDLADAFSQDLAFGTAGMRGKLGLGPNRMNIYTVAKAALAYGTYLLETFRDVDDKKVAIAYDNRHQSEEFAQVSASIFSNLGIKTFIYDGPRSTPQLSFAIRHLSCIGGVVITASHNPPEYNGFKVYDETGSQLVDHKIAKVIHYTEHQFSDETQLKIGQIQKDLVFRMPSEVDEAYLKRLESISQNNEHKISKLVFTSQHGTAYPYLNEFLINQGYDLVVVEEQKSYDPDFSQTLSPNPEDKKAYKLALKYAEKEAADAIIACDPDADRMGVVVRHNEEYQYLTGNQTGAILQEYLFSQKEKKGQLSDRDIMFNTIVTSDLGDEIAKSYGIEVKKTLTGFKYIGEQIEKLKSSHKNFVFGYEESYGYLVSDFVRDKDAFQASFLIAEAINHYKLQGLSLIDVLKTLYEKHGHYYETQDSLVLEGQEGQEKITEIMSYYRQANLSEVAGKKIKYLDDYLISKRSNGQVLDLPKANVLKYHFEDGSWMAIRPSGTEPKIKFYYCLLDQSMEAAQTAYKELSSFVMEKL